MIRCMMERLAVVSGTRDVAVVVKTNELFRRVVGV